MTQPNADRPPLVSITKSDLYRLRLSKPRLEKIKSWEDGTVSAFLFFSDAAGNCLNVKYSTAKPKALAMLVGKITGKFTNEIRMGATPAEFIDYIAPACNIITDISVEVEPDMRLGVHHQFNGKLQYKYRLNFGKGTVKPEVKPKADEAIDF